AAAGVEVRGSRGRCCGTVPHAADAVAGVTRLMPERLRRPLRSPSFRRLVLGKSISYLGDWLMVAVLVGWVYQSTASVAQVALLMAVRLVPPIVGGGLA